jgi:hypothetical protein
VDILLVLLVPLLLFAMLIVPTAPTLCNQWVRTPSHATFFPAPILPPISPIPLPISPPMLMRGRARLLRQPVESDDSRRAHEAAAYPIDRTAAPWQVICHRALVIHLQPLLPYEQNEGNAHCSCGQSHKHAELARLWEEDTEAEHAEGGGLCERPFEVEERRLLFLI